jgi:hypothetical protein
VDPLLRVARLVGRLARPFYAAGGPRLGWVGGPKVPGTGRTYVPRRRSVLIGQAIRRRGRPVSGHGVTGLQFHRRR